MDFPGSTSGESATVHHTIGKTTSIMHEHPGVMGPEVTLTVAGFDRHHDKIAIHAE